MFLWFSLLASTVCDNWNCKGVKIHVLNWSLAWRPRTVQILFYSEPHRNVTSDCLAEAQGRIYTYRLVLEIPGHTICMWQLRLYRGQHPFTYNSPQRGSLYASWTVARPKGHVLFSLYFTSEQNKILLRTLWEETWVTKLPSSPPKQSSVKFWFCSSVKYDMDFVLCHVSQSNTA